MLYRDVENGVIDRVFRPNSKYLVGEALFCVEIYRDFFAWELRSKIISRSEPASNEKFRNESSRQLYSGDSLSNSRLACFSFQFKYQVLNKYLSKYSGFVS
jgi:hypothetical protein